MKKRMIYCCYYTIIFTLLLAALSCKNESFPTIDDFQNKVPKNVHLSDYSNTSITLAWDRIENAASYTVQLLESGESDSPIDTYTTVTKDFYRFSSLNETDGYCLRVRANFNSAENPVIGDWVYIMDGQEPARIMPKYGVVDKDFEEPELYPNFPEGWEVHEEGARKSSYTALGPTGRQSDVFASGEWIMNQAYTTNSGTALIHKVGDFATMMAPNQKASLEMDFDLPYGASKFSFICGAATRTNANEINGMPIVLTVEYSQDSGGTWTKLNNDVLIDDIEKQYTLEYDLDLKEPVRFRISKNNSRARPIIDEVAGYYKE